MLPKTGRKLHHSASNLAFADLVAQALTNELGKTHQAVKTVMRWTGASERSVKHWLAGTHAPHGRHLIDLMRHSDMVTCNILTAAGRNDLIVAAEISQISSRLREVLAILDRPD